MTTIYQYGGLAVDGQDTQPGNDPCGCDDDCENLTLALALTRDRIEQALAHGETNRLSGLFREYDVLVVELIQLQTRVADIALRAADRARQQARAIVELSNWPDIGESAELH